MKLNIKLYTLSGAGTEIDNFNVTDSYDEYLIKGTATATGNYAISLTGTPQAGEFFRVKYKGLLDITTGSKTFSILGQTLTQLQLNSDLDIECFYDGSAWDVLVKPSFTSAVVASTNLATDSVATTHIQNGAVTEPKLATNSVSTNKIVNLNVTTGKIADLGVTDAKINDVNGSKITSSTVTNAKLATMADQTVKGNISGGSANPSDIPLSTLVNASSWGLTGNSGTTAGTNFIGTTDAVDLVFKAYNLQSGRIDGDNNTSFGLLSLSSNISGNDNSSFGRASLQNLTTGRFNCGLGSSLVSLTTADYNTALGYGALNTVVSGSNNTSVGYQSGQTITTGSSNTIVGQNADVSSATAVNRISIGAGAEATSDYQFAIPDDVTTIKFRGLVYNLPTSQAAGVLTNDGSGNLTWV